MAAGGAMRTVAVTDWGSAVAVPAVGFFFWGGFDVVVTPTYNRMHVCSLSPAPTSPTEIEIQVGQDYQCPVVSGINIYNPDARTVSRG